MTPSNPLAVKFRRRASAVSRGAACVAALALAACGSTVTTAQRTDQAAAEQVVQGPHAPAGTRVTVRLRTAIDVPLGPTSPHLEADLVEPVRTAQGEVLVPAGAAVRGTISWTGSSTRVALDDATVESPVGALALRATVRGPAIRRALSGPARSPEDRDEAVAREASPGAAPLVRSRVSEGSGVDAAPAPGTRFVLPAGSELRLTLTAPLLAPNATVLTVR